MFGARYFGARNFGGRYFGKRGQVVDGAYFGPRQFGNRYFGKRYFGHNDATIPFVVAQTTGISVSGTVGIAGGLTYGADFSVTQTAGVGLTGSLLINGSGFSYESEVFYFTPPLAITGLSGSLTVAGNLTISAPAPGYGGYWGRRYYGARHFGPRYFGTPVSWRVTQTAGIGLSGSLNVAGGISTVIGIAETTGIGLSGSLTVEGAVDIAARPSGGYRPVAYSGPRKRNYIVQGQKFYDLTTEELAAVVAQMGRVKRKDIKVEVADQKPKTLDSETWQEVKPDDDEDVLLLL